MRKAALGLVIALASLLPAVASESNGSDRRAAALARHLAEETDAPVIGNPRGRDVVVEFFDYRCPYCRAFEPVLRRLLTEDREARLVLEEWPILGGASLYAARVALAARWQGRFRQVHEALLDDRSPLDRQRIRDIAEAAGIDLVRLDRDMTQRRTEIDRVLRRAAAEASGIHLKGTPGVVVGERAISGALTLDDLKSLLATERRRAVQADERP